MTKQSGKSEDRKESSFEADLRNSLANRFAGLRQEKKDNAMLELIKKQTQLIDLLITKLTND